MDAVRTASVEPADTDAVDAPMPLVADAERAPIGRPPASGRRMRNGIPVAAASVAAHLLLLAVALLLSRAPDAPVQSQETAVEVVQEAPPEAAKAGAASAQKGGEAKDKAASPAPAPPADKPEAQTAAPALKVPAPNVPALEAPQPVEPPKPQQAQSPTQHSPAAPTAPAEAAKLQALQQELAALQTQKADLQAQAEAERQAQAEAQAQAQADVKAKADTQARSRAATFDQTKALGLLPESFSAAALPPPSVTGEDPVTYEQAVYSIVNKARRSDRSYMPGVAHVVFDIDAKGGLARVVIDHSSGNAATDEEALSLIRRAAPFPPPPDGVPRSFPAYMSFVADH